MRIMNTKKDIQRLKKIWEDLCDKEQKEAKELQDLSDKSKGTVTNEISQKYEQHTQTLEKTQNALADYHRACRENIKEKMSEMEPVLQDAFKKKFDKIQKETNDWDSFMEEEKLWC